MSAGTSKPAFGNKSFNAVIQLSTRSRVHSTPFSSTQGSFSAEKGVRLTHIRCMANESLRASATGALRIPRRRATLGAQSLNQPSPLQRVRIELAAS
ncbi:hypothetical protein HNO88_004390 [Novosphingobium chloroacetimidivorans]|uniref:Uncharacterized protein n=1 Tax=Novosphingobium chloroacetimidivorans TaxID=1428314 RepID=A0A7W7KDX3_9SPHN|nr:hypothetical protein [Novosphingobium chloroacetimidivorans]